MRVRIELDLSEDHLEAIVRDAVSLYGFMREDPRRAWTNEEYKRAVRWVVQHKLARKI